MINNSSFSYLQKVLMSTFLLSYFPTFMAILKCLCIKQC